MGATQGLIDQIDQVIGYFNKRTLDLPDGLFDRKTQFVVNGTPFENFLSKAPNDPLVLMLARGPAGYRGAIEVAEATVDPSQLDRIREARLQS